MKYEDDSKTESEALILRREDFSVDRGRSSRRTLHFLLFISVALNFAIVGFGFMYWNFSGPHSHSSYSKGFASDLEPSKPEIELVQYTFTGGVKLDDNGTYFVDDSSESQQYVGPPSPSVDEAWGRLMSGLNMDLEASTAEGLQGRTFQWPDTDDYFTGLDVFHSLHCLNRIRQALFPEYYNVFNNPDDPDRNMHIGHCINHIRQAIQCHADLTPMEWVHVGDKVVLRTDTTHTCRDFDKIRHWASQRRTVFQDKEMVRNGSLFIVD